MDATCTIQDSIHVFSLVHKYVSRILGTYHIRDPNLRRLLSAYPSYGIISNQEDRHMIHSGIRKSDNALLLNIL